MSEEFIDAPEVELEAIPTIEGKAAAAKVLKEIRGRSFSGRNPSLGKMIKCQFCLTRHRQNERVCEQIFATGRYDLRDPKLLLIAGQTPETTPTPPHSQIKVVLGAANVKGKRRRPPLNKRANEFVQLVHSLVPDEYTKEELEKARNKVKRILAERYGRYGFLPPLKRKA